MTGNVMTGNVMTGAWRTRFPRRTIHLDFHTGPDIPDVGAEFDVDAFARTFVDAHVDSVRSSPSAITDTRSTGPTGRSAIRCWPPNWTCSANRSRRCTRRGYGHPFT